MKQLKILETATVMENPDSLHNYFAWPTAAALPDGRLAAAASGYRLDHVCPFGKGVITYSADGGKSWSRPEAVIDTVLDDRDGGLAVHGDTAVFTSFNNTLEFQRKIAHRKSGPRTDYILAYLDYIASLPGAEAVALGSTFRLSHDGGSTWEKELHHSPVSAPHGPCWSLDGRLFYVGCVFGDWNRIECWEMDPATGAMEKRGELPPIGDGSLPSEEPHAIVLKDGSILAMIRTERQPEDHNWQNGYEIFTLYQSVSHDGGVSWSEPAPLKVRGDSPDPMRLGAPGHLCRAHDGRLILSAGDRIHPLGLNIYVSGDEGESWEAYRLPCDLPNTVDFGYPATVSMADGSYYTVWYQHPTIDEPSVIVGARWCFPDNWQ